MSSLTSNQQQELSSSTPLYYWSNCRHSMGTCTDYRVDPSIIQNTHKNIFHVSSLHYIPMIFNLIVILLLIHMI